MSDLPLKTRVAHAYAHEHEFCGKKLFAELLGRERFVGLIARSVGLQRELLDYELDLLDELAVITTVADPRIWPLKIVRVVSSYGGLYPAWAVANLCLDGAQIGPDACGRAAQSLVTLRAALESATDQEIERELDVRFPSLLPPLGFGVPFRSEDERVVAVRRRLIAHGRAELPYWKFFERLADIFRAQRNFEPNIGSALSAAALDLGFSALAVGPLAAALVQCAFLANAVEGAEQAPELLRSLPNDRVDYRGKAARKSPRASKP